MSARWTIASDEKNWAAAQYDGALAGHARQPSEERCCRTRRASRSGI